MGTPGAELKEERKVAMHDVASVGLDTKVCPRCGERLFADMEVCYGCLYDFTRKKPRPLLPDPPRIDAEEVSADPFVPYSGGEDAPLAFEYPMLPMAHEEVPPGPDETAVLSSASLGVLIRTEDVDVCVPLPRHGLVVGRGPDCDVVLHAGTVSRRHVSLVPTVTGAVVEDLGSTNPARALGRLVEGAVPLGVGDSVNVCGSELVIVDRTRRRRGASAELPTTRIEVPL